MTQRSADHEARSPAATAEALRRTLPGRLVLAAREHGDRTALLQKGLGIYVRYSWQDYADAVAAAALAFDDQGIGPGSVVGILSDNRVEWIIADLAAQSLGAVAVGIYPTNSAPEVEYVLRHAGVDLILVEDQEQIDKVLQARDVLRPDLTVVVLDPRGTRGYDADFVAWSELFEHGERRLLEDPGYLCRAVASIDADAPTVLIYTSGTTSQPKAAMWSQRVMTAQADRLIDAFGMTGEDTVLSYLPLCHGAERLITELVSLTTGGRVHFGESISTVQADLAEIGPTLFVGMPRIWEKIRASVEKSLRRSSWLKRSLFAWCLRRGERLVAAEGRGERRRSHRMVRWFLDLVMFRALREHIGLERAWFVMSGGAPIGPDLLRWIRAIGVPVIEGYGLTEGGVTHLAPPGAPPRIGTVGVAMDDVECTIADDHELLLRSATNFLGYLHDPDATRETLTDDGWLHTGDLGEIDEDGSLRIVGRKKDIIITAGGKNLSPAAIENAMKSSPYIAQAVPAGDRHPFVSALVQIDWETVGDWAAQSRVPYTSFEDLSTKPEVVKLIEDEVAKANSLLARASQVREVRLLPKQLHQDDGELTATQKVRRRAVLEKFSSLVDDIYGGGTR